VPENDVEKVFAASDVVIFPYRAKMSASGALSLAWRYGVPVLFSGSFAKNYKEKDTKLALGEQGIKINDLSFRLNENDFENKLLRVLRNKQLSKSIKAAGLSLVESRSWERVANLYLDVIMSKEPLFVYETEEVVYAKADQVAGELSRAISE
jgi:glycosyltransferase involved in cell wall biosynthesis